MSRVTGCCSNANAAGETAGHTLRLKLPQNGLLHYRIRLAVVFLLFIMMGSAANALASQTQWTGDQSPEWSNPDNWTNGVPDENTEAVIRWFNQNNPDPVITGNTTFHKLNIGNFGREVRVELAPGVEVQMNELQVAASGSGRQSALNVGDGVVTVNNGAVISGGIIVGDGTIHFPKDFQMTANGDLSVATGKVKVGRPGSSQAPAKLSVSSNANFNLNQGTLKVFGPAIFENSATFNAGEGQMYFDDDITLRGNASFNPESSTAHITGNSTITVLNNIDGNTIYFYDLFIDQGAEVIQDANVEVLNDLYLPDDESINNPQGFSLNVLGTTNYSTHTISGTITLDGSGLADITVYATGDISETVTTDGNGYYEFTGISDGANVTITPVDQRHEFSPRSIPLGNIQQDADGIDFTAVSLPSAIMGRVINEDDKPVQGVSINGFLEGSYNRTVKTNEAGYFLLHGFAPGNRDIIITPELEGYSFIPEDEEVRVHQNNNPYPDLVEFTAILDVTLYSISGLVTDENNNPLQGVEIRSTGGHEATVFTNNQGYFVFDHVTEGSKAIQLSPFLPGYSFDPDIRQIQRRVTSNIDGQDFSATSITAYTVSGNITEGNNTPLPGVKVVATGDYTRTVYSDANGNYRFDGVKEGSDLVITPVLPGYIFDPESRSVNNLSSDQTGLNFNAETLDDGTISGEITDEYGNPMAAVNVECDEATPASIATNAAGFYQFSGLGTGNNPVEVTVTPELDGYYFEPPSMTFSNRYGDLRHVTGIDFTAILIPPDAFYSRQTGNWNEPNTWSVTGHDGPAASQAPQGDKDVFIGGSNGNDHTVTLTGNISLDEGVTLTVYDTGNGAGTLATGGPSNNYQVNGGGSFVLQTGGTLHIASPEGITQSANEGNIRTAQRSFSSGANYVYNGNTAQQTGNGLPQNVNDLRIDNPDNVTAQQSHAVNGQLQLVNGLFIMPPGSSLLADNVSRTGGDLRMQLTIDGNKGWRMITSPAQTNYADMMDGFVSQGFDGSDYPDKQPNLLWFDETEIGTTNMAWRAPGALTDNTTGGRGYFFYIFDGAGIVDSQGNPTGNNYSDELPITMDVTGLEHATGGSNFNVTYTARSEGDITDTDIVEMNTGWNMVGNPSTASINWHADNGWNKTNIDETVYVWDPSANNGEGEFLVSNGTTGTLDQGLIAPFQAFWVRANAANPELVMNNNAKTLGGAYIGTTASASKSEEVATGQPLPGDASSGGTLPPAKGQTHPAGQAASGNNPTTADSGSHADTPVTTRTTRNPIDLEMRLEADGMETHSFVSFSEKGRMGEDPYDGYRLESMNDNWLKLYTTTDQHDKPLVINHLPAELEGNLRIPMYVEGERNGQKLNGSYHLHWSMPDNWPADWEVVLMDHQEEKAISMGWESSYRFDLYSTKSTVPVNQGREFPMPGQIVASVDKPVTRTSDKPNRFTLVINPNGDFEEPEYSPDTPRLLEPSPNPVRTSTDITFVMPEAGHVDIRIYDLHGRSLQHLVSREYELGRHSITWNPGRLPAGVYIIEMRSGETREAKKVIVQH